MDKHTPKHKSNQWRRRSWWNLKRKSPIRHKAYRMKMSLTTWKVRDALTLAKIYDRLCRPQICPFCRRTMDFEEISWDHIIPRCNHGKDEMANLQFCCIKCNRLKGGLTHNEFARLLEVFGLYPDVIPIYEKRIRSSLAYFSNPGTRIKYPKDVASRR